MKTDEFYLDCIARIEQGDSISKLARELGITRQSLHKCLSLFCTRRGVSITRRVTLCAPARKGKRDAS